MNKWMFLEDDHDLIADLLLFYPAAVSYSAPPTPPPAPPSRHGCSSLLECSNGNFNEVFILTEQSRPPILPILTVGAALLCSVACLALFFGRRVYKRKMEALFSFKPSNHLSHVVLNGPPSQEPAALIYKEETASGIPDMYGGYGATLPSGAKISSLASSLVILDGRRPSSSSSKEHLNPIYEEVDQQEEARQALEFTQRYRPSERKYQFVAIRPGENIYASIEDQRFC